MNDDETDTLKAALGDREAEQVLAEQPPLVAFGVAAPPVSDDAFNLIVRHETGGRAYYEKVIRARPIWPAGASGVTIGFGYDIGYADESDLRADWAALGHATLDRLARACGKHGGKTPDGELKALVATLRDIAVPWDPSLEVFRRRTMPKFTALTANALPHADRLSPDSFGALVSLTFNRGPSYGTPRKPTDTIDRYREMRAIKAAMRDEGYALIPDLIRAMIRIWRGTGIETEMTRRRRNEALLFAHGLAPGGGAFVPSFGVGEGEVDPVAAIEAAATTGHDDEKFRDVTEEEALDEPLSFGVAASAAAVRWAADDEAPDYAHLVEAPPPGSAFRLTPAALEALASANAFEPTADRVLFGLRGCAVLGEGGEFAAEAKLRDLRPDHQTARCVLGVWDRAGNRLAVFPGSTVPNAKAVVDWFSKHNQGNMLPSGMYGYVVGVHNGKPGCFLLRKPDGTRRRVVVRRSSADLSYSRDDMVDPCEPGDNIHPTFFGTTAGFSSVGCQVVVGSATPAGEHRGPWAAFRAAAGQQGTGGHPGTPFDYLLLTGAEALLASGGAAPRRLRQGSSGEAVSRLQGRLNLPDPDGRFGTNTAVALHALQRRRSGGRSDGIFTPAMDQALGWDVFG